MREELQRLGWPPEGLRAQPKGHRAKVMLAQVALAQALMQDASF